MRVQRVQHRSPEELASHADMNDKIERRLHELQADSERLAEMRDVLRACIVRLERWPGIENPEGFPEVREARRLLR